MVDVVVVVHIIFVVAVLGLGLVVVGHRNLTLNFGENLFSNSRDIVVFAIGVLLLLLLLLLLLFLLFLLLLFSLLLLLLSLLLLFILGT